MAKTPRTLCAKLVHGATSTYLGEQYRQAVVAGITPGKWYAVQSLNVGGCRSNLSVFGAAGTWNSVLFDFELRDDAYEESRPEPRLEWYEQEIERLRVQTTEQFLEIKRLEGIVLERGKK